MSLLLGIDLGTSSVKVALVDANNLQVIARSSCDYPTYYPQPAFAEQNPEDWWQAIIISVQSMREQVNTRDIVSIGVSGQMHGIVCLDNSNKPVCQAIIWADTRSIQEVELLKQFRDSSSKVYPGLPATGFAAASLLWLSQNKPNILAQTHHCLMPKDYICYRLTGKLGTEHSDASASWLYDNAERNWNADLVRYCGLTMSQMPNIAESDHVIGYLTDEAVEELNLSSDIAVVAGTADLPAQALAHGVIDEDSILITIGTGGQVFVPLTSSQSDKKSRYHVFCHNIPNHWYAQAAILSAGLSLNWLSGVFAYPERDFTHLSQIASTVEVGASGLVFLPYLAGERSPHMDPLASSMLFGLRLHHTQAHIVRAVMEGVGFAIKDCIGLVTQTRMPYKKVILSGGIIKSAVWRQILADILEVPIQFAQSDVPHGCIGAAILAGLGMKLYKDVYDALTHSSGTVQVIQPEPSPIYRERYETYQRLYPLLKSEMNRLVTVGR